MAITSFDAEIQNELKSYVYRLIDPRNGETFYVGKGKGNRIFSHMKAELEIDKNDYQDESFDDLKLQRIRNIRNEGLDVIHIIQRHGLNDNEASLVEAVLIDAIPGLTNIQNGKYNSDYGAMNASQVIQKYKSEPFKLDDDIKLMILSINKSINTRDTYSAVNYAWRVSLERANEADYILASSQGIIRDVFIADSWLPATKEHFPEKESEIEGRYGFHGQQASDDILKKYVGKKLPKDLAWKPGNSNPIRYSY